MLFPFAVFVFTDRVVTAPSFPKVENVFNACCATVPTDALRRHLLAMAPSPEAFLTCR